MRVSVKVFPGVRLYFGGHHHRRRRGTSPLLKLNPKFVAAFFAAAGVVFVWTAITHGPRSETITRAGHPGSWPLTVDTAVMECHNDALIIKSGGTSYILNGAPFGSYVNADPITADDPAFPGEKMSLDGLIAEGRKLC